MSDDERFSIRDVLATIREELAAAHADAAQNANAAIKELLAHDVSLARLQIRPRSLEDLFLELTGRELRA